MDYRIRYSYVLLNPDLTPDIPCSALERMTIAVGRKPKEMHCRGSSCTEIRGDEVSADRHIRDVILPDVLVVSERLKAAGYWILLEGQTMIRLAHEIMKSSKLPVTVQVMDPPYNYFRVHNVDRDSQDELFLKYEFVMTNAKACAAASWSMAEQYSEAFRIPCFSVVPSLPEELAQEAAQFPSQSSTFRIALAGQIYARDEWNALMSVLEKLRDSERKAIEVHAFTRDLAVGEPVNGIPVRVHPWMTTEELLKQLQEMDLLYCIYRFGDAFREESELCFPSKLTTYLASGRPVLFHGPENSSPARFLAQWDAAFFCYSQNPNELASVVRSAMSDRQEYERIAANGVKAFAERLSYRYLSNSIQAALEWRGLQNGDGQEAGRCKETARGIRPAPGAGGPQTVLVIGMAESIHVVRWMRMVSACTGLRFVLCPVFRPDAARIEGGHVAINPDFRATRVVRAVEDIAAMAPGDVGIFDLESVEAQDLAAADRATGFEPYRPSFLPPDWRFTLPGHVAAAIERFRPGLVISLEIQFAGYLALATKDYLGGAFPRWLVSNWGSDIYLYRKLGDHEPKLRRIAQVADAYIAECHRDVGIMRQMGFRGRVLPTMPASGGVDFADFPGLGDLPPPSARREIQIKGYHGWSGRALHVLAAVHLAAAELSGFAIRVILAGPQVRAMAETMARRDNLDIACEPYVASHAESIARLARARISVGLGISDGISTTLLESMAVGTFPVKGTSSCACEWIESGRTGMIVSPHDTRAMAEALVRAAHDDALVDAAAPVNRKTVEQRWDAACNRDIIAGHLLELAAS